MQKMNVENNGPSEMFLENPFIKLGPFSKIRNSNIAGNNCIGISSAINRVTLGKYAGIGSYAYVVDTVIGRYCTFGSRTSIGGFNHPVDWLSVHEFQYRDTSQIYGETIITDNQNILSSQGDDTQIGCDVWIGDNVAVARGVKIGHGAIIGMSTVVTRDIEPFSIVIGNPGRVLRMRFDDATIARLLDLKWWELDIGAMAGIDFKNVDAAIDILTERKAKAAGA